MYKSNNVYRKYIRSSSSKYGGEKLTYVKKKSTYKDYSCHTKQNIKYLSMNCVIVILKELIKFTFIYYFI